MFLQQIELFGFKSFADRTCIKFVEGITALLGPNGCGKSNIVDAVKWVIGEQSARSLRAENMEDVIFNGTITRNPLSLAEVTLTISNEKGSFNGIAAAELVIKRRLYRSGEAEYSINGTLCRLKDIRELFWDTGIGKSAYSVMEQGKIDQILSSRPEDRRFLFEEAAGITRHKVKSKEAEQRLAQTESNMKDVSNIIAEVKRSYDSLKVQAEKTQRYRAIKDEVFANDIDVFLLRLRQFKSDKHKLEKEREVQQKQHEQIIAKITELEIVQQEGLDQVNRMEKELVELQRIGHGYSVQRAGIGQSSEVLENLIKDARNAMTQTSYRIKLQNDKIESQRKSEEEKVVALESLAVKLIDINKNILDFEGQVKAAETGIKENEESICQAERDVQSLDQKKQLARQKLDAITEDIVSQLDKRLKESGYSAKDRKNAEAAMEDCIHSILSIVNAKASILNDLARSGTADPKSRERIITKTAHDLADVHEKVQSLFNQYQSYIRSSLSFIDEFLAPQGIITQKRSIDKEIADLEAKAVAYLQEIEVMNTHNKSLTARINECRLTLEALRGNTIKMQTQKDSLEESLVFIRVDLQSQESYLNDLVSQSSKELTRLQEAEGKLLGLQNELQGLEKSDKKLNADTLLLQKSIKEKTTFLSSNTLALQALHRNQTSMHTTLESLHVSYSQIETEIKNIKENFSEQHSRDLIEFESRMYEITSNLTTLKEKAASLKQNLKDIGQVNFMAPEEYADVKERYDFLSSQYSDLEKARVDLTKITDEIRQESAALFIDTYNKIKRNFHNIFRRLFGGGRAELKLIDPNHILESGIEIYAQPTGKKLEIISLLSGGERTLTAIALLFATYMVRPSPFCFLDEIDAALDEQNVRRFIDLLREFSRNSQFIVITHNKKSITGSDSLLGITMQEDGISRTISIKLERGPQGEFKGYNKPIQEEDVAYEEGQELPPQTTTRKRKKNPLNQVLPLQEQVQLVQSPINSDSALSDKENES